MKVVLKVLSWVLGAIGLYIGSMVLFLFPFVTFIILVMKF